MFRSDMLVTIIVDASHCPDTKAAGWGCWIVSTRGRHHSGHAMRELVVNNSVAEMMAVVNGLWKAHAKGIMLQGDKVLIQTDCMAAINALTGVRICRVPQELEVVKAYAHALDKLRVTVELRHVKGHSLGTEKKDYVQQRCDYAAGQAMRALRGQIKRSLKDGGFETHVGFGLERGEGKVSRPNAAKDRRRARPKHDAHANRAVPEAAQEPLHDAVLQREAV
jgi:ribonuclease HI